MLNEWVFFLYETRAEAEEVIFDQIDEITDLFAPYKLSVHLLKCDYGSLINWKSETIEERAIGPLVEQLKQFYWKLRTTVKICFNVGYSPVESDTIHENVPFLAVVFLGI